MRPLRYSINVTLDGCCDHRVGIADEELHRHAVENITQADALLFGRVTYEMMEAAWRPPPGTGARPQWMEPFARTISAAKKYVVSSTLERVDWNAELIRGDLATTVQRLKREPGKGLFTGGVTLPQALAELGLIDEYELIVHPRLVGHGPTLFAGLSKPVDLKLVGRLELGSGAVALRYEPRRQEIEDIERAKMLRGELYLAGDPDLVEARRRARRLWQRFNANDPMDPAAGRAVLAELLGGLGVDAWVEAPFYCDYGGQITLGDGVFVNMNCVFLDPAPIVIGPQAQLGPGVHLLTATHPLGAAARTAGPELARPIAIGARAWLGGGVIVGPGVTIGPDAVVGAGSVVVRDLPGGVLAVGNPCRVVRELESAP